MMLITKNYIGEKWQHAGFQKYFKNIGWMFISRILCMVISFFTTAFVASKLGPENYGQLNYAVSIVSIFSILATLGIDNVLYRDLIKYPDKKREFLGSALTIKLLAGALTAIIIICTQFFIIQNDVSKILIFILSGTLIFNAFQIINYEFQAQIKSIYPSIISVIVTIILNLLKIFTIILDEGVIYLAFILLFESVLYAIFYWYFYEKKLGGELFHWKFDKVIAVTLLKDSWPLIFSISFSLIFTRIDQVLIKHMMDAKSVGIYAAAVTIAESWYFIPGILTMSLFPAIINAKMTSDELYNSRLTKLATLLVILAVIAAIVTTFFSHFIINYLYGPAFMDSVKILQIYVWAGIGTFLLSLTTNYLIAENYREILITTTFISMISNIILNLIWIPKYGIIGSAYATLISYSLGPLTLLLFKRTRKVVLSIFTKTEMVIDNS